MVRLNRRMTIPNVSIVGPASKQLLLVSKISRLMPPNRGWIDSDQAFYSMSNGNSHHIDSVL